MYTMIPLWHLFRLLGSTGYRACWQPPMLRVLLPLYHDRLMQELVPKTNSTKQAIRYISQTYSFAVGHSSLTEVNVGLNINSISS